MKYLYTGLIFSLSMLVFACKKNIQVNLSNYTEGVVIYSVISDIDSFQTQVMHTTSYYDVLQDNLLKSASVTITNLSTNSNYNLYTNGNYFYFPKVGFQKNNYSLTVNYNGQTYTANATMPQKVNLDSVTFEKTNLLGSDIINTIVHFQDIPKDSNYYRFNVTVINNGKSNSFNFQDRFSDGKYVHYTLRNDSSFIHENDSIKVEMMCITKAAYQFYYGIESTSGATEKILSSISPANPPTNLSNNALGLFDVQTRQAYHIKVPNEFINTIKWEDIITW